MTGVVGEASVFGACVTGVCTKDIGINDQIVLTADPDDARAEQFSLGDLRPLDEVVRDVAALGYIPSFCTACYRLGRTGADFMDLAKPGEIKSHCDPNALSTFQEYLIDYASAETRQVGENLIALSLGRMNAKDRARAEAMLAKVREGKRDVYC